MRGRSLSRFVKRRLTNWDSDKCSTGPGCPGPELPPDQARDGLSKNTPHRYREAEQELGYAAWVTGTPASITDPGASPVANGKPSSAQPVMPPSISFTGLPNCARRIAPRSPPLQ